MGTRGYDLVGTGYFGPKTKAAVLDLQSQGRPERRRLHRAEDLGGGLERRRRGPGRCGAGGVDL